jgi:hypothetical protein
MASLPEGALITAEAGTTPRVDISEEKTKEAAMNGCKQIISVSPHHPPRSNSSLYLKVRKARERGVARVLKNRRGGEDAVCVLNPRSDGQIFKRILVVVGQE